MYDWEILFIQFVLRYYFNHIYKTNDGKDVVYYMKNIKISFITINQETYYGLHDIFKLVSGSIDIKSLGKHIVYVKFFDNSSPLKYISIDGIELLADLNQDISLVHKRLEHVLPENQIDMKHHIITLYV